MTCLINSITSCFGCCPWSNWEYETQLRAPDGTYVPVDKERTSDFEPNDSDTGSFGDTRTDIYPAGSLNKNNSWKALKGFDYKKYGFVYSKIGWVYPNEVCDCMKRD